MAGQRKAFNPYELAHLRVTLRLGTRDRALFEVQLAGAVRPGDLLALSVGDVTTPRGDVVEDVTIVEGKTGRAHTFPLTPEAREAVGRYLATRGPALNRKAPLFTGSRGPQTGKAMSTRGYLDVVKRWADDAQVADSRRYGGHSLRRTALQAAHAINGRDVVQTAQIANHASVNSTVEYLATDKAEAFKSYHAWLAYV